MAMKHKMLYTGGEFILWVENFVFSTHVNSNFPKWLNYLSIQFNLTASMISIANQLKEVIINKYQTISIPFDKIDVNTFAGS